MFKRKIINFGGSLAITIPKAEVDYHKYKAGELVKVAIARDWKEDKEE